MGKFIQAVRDLEPLLSVQMEGAQDPSKRFAGMRLEFSGENAAENAHALMDLLLAEVDAE